jgi:hypothetical protein
MVPLDDSDNPGGRTPPANAHTHGVLATSVVEYDELTMPFGSAPVSIIGAAFAAGLAAKGRQTAHSRISAAAKTNSPDVVPVWFFADIFLTIIITDNRR